MGTGHDRFTIGNYTEGFIAGFKTYAEALAAAQRHKYPKSIEIFDVMAHHGGPNTWNWMGEVMRSRQR